MNSIKDKTDEEKEKLKEQYICLLKDKVAKDIDKLKTKIPLYNNDNDNEMDDDDEEIDE